ncbi:MAG TPA: hypothetical protein VLY04_25600 [Bryobacteraceae bacterium]|nr:hypothetical protein [Bryobacteraceae bacterium]
MDAAQTNFKKTALLLTLALLLAAPVYGVSAPTLQLSANQVTIGPVSCNQMQTVNLSSSGAGFNFTVNIHYQNGNDITGDAHGLWAYAQILGAGTTENGTTFNASVPDSSVTGGVNMTVGLALANFSVNQQASAQVVLTPQAPANTNPVTIAVNFQYNTSCAGNSGQATNGTTLTITPGSVSLNVPQNGQNSVSINLQNLTGSAYTLASCTIQGSPAWLSLPSCATTSIPANSSVNLTLTATGTGFTVGQQLNTQITFTPPTGGPLGIPVQVTITAGSGGGGGGSGSTLTLNGATSNVANVNFTYVAQKNGVPQSLPVGVCVSVQDTDTSATGYSWTAATTTGGPWLLANSGQPSGTTTILFPPSNPQCVVVQLSNAVVNLAAGAYQGTLTITSISNSGSTATINVNLFVTPGSPAGITVSPDLTFAFPGVVVGATTPEQQQFTVSAAGNATITGTATPTSSPSWFSMTTPSGGPTSQTFVVTVNPTGLTAGVYSNEINVTTSGGQTTILITLTVGTTGGGGGTTSSVVLPTTLAFQQQSGSTYFSSGQEYQTIVVNGAQGTQWSASINYVSGLGWLQFDQGSATGTIGSGPGSILVDLAAPAGNLIPGSYTANVEVTTPSGTVPVTVSLLVTPSSTPVLLGQPASSTFIYAGSAPASQTVTVVGSDNTSSTTSPLIQATTTVNWLTASTSGNTMTLSLVPGNVAALAVGSYATTVAVTNGGYTNQLNYPVVLVVTSGGIGSGALTLSTSSMTFNAVAGSTVPGAQNLTVQAPVTTTFSASTSEQSCAGSNWLGISPSGTMSTPATIQVSVNQSAISAGTTCNGTISLTVNGNAQTVNVSMVVSASGTGGNVTVTPTSMTFPYTQGGTVPAAQTATIVNAVSGTASIAFTVSTAVSGGVANWIQTNVTQAQTPYNNPGLSVSVVPGSLSPGNYQGTVTISPTGGTQQTIQVTMAISGSAIVTASPTTLTLSYTVGGNTPTGTIQVSAGGAQANFTAVAATTGSGSWLSVSPTSGTTPNTGTFNLTVSINPTNLSSGQYTGSVTVTGTSPASGTTIVNITLNVTAPLPTITGINNGASGATGAVSPGEVIQIFANATNPIGPATAVQLNSTTCPSPCTSVPTLMGGVQVLFLPIGIPAPLLMVSAGQINAVVPYEVAGLANFSVEVKYLGQSSNAFPLTGATVAPGIFSANLTGTGQAVAWMYDGQGNFKGPNTPATPAQKGWIIAFYMTGEGLTSPYATGKVIQNSTTFPLLVPSVQLGGQPTTLAGYAEAGGVVSGVLQINFFVPQNAPSGSAVSLAVSIGGKSSQAGITVAIQ